MTGRRQPFLTQADLDELRWLLEADRDRLKRRVHTLGAAGPIELDQSAVGRVSRPCSPER